MRVGRARAADVAEIQEIITHYAGGRILLSRAEADIRSHLDFFLVAADRSGVAGCVSLEVYHPALAEIRSLAVTPAKVGRGLGARMVKAALERAERRGISRVF